MHCDEILVQKFCYLGETMKVVLCHMFLQTDSSKIVYFKYVREEKKKKIRFVVTTIDWAQRIYRRQYTICLTMLSYEQICVYCDFTSVIYHPRPKTHELIPGCLDIQVLEWSVKSAKIGKSEFHFLPLHVSVDDHVDCMFRRKGKKNSPDKSDLLEGLCFSF